MDINGLTEMVDGDNLRLLSLVADMSAKGELQSSRNDTQPLIQVQEGDVENLAASMMATAAEVSTVAFDATTENPPQMMEVSETASTSNVRAVDVYDVKKTPDMYYHPFHHGGPMATPYFWPYGMPPWGYGSFGMPYSHQQPPPVPPYQPYENHAMLPIFRPPPPMTYQPSILPGPLSVSDQRINGESVCGVKKNTPPKIKEEVENEDPGIVTIELSDSDDDSKGIRGVRNAARPKKTVKKLNSKKFDFVAILGYHPKGKEYYFLIRWNTGPEDDSWITKKDFVDQTWPNEYLASSAKFAISPGVGNIPPLSGKGKAGPKKIRL